MIFIYIIVSFDEKANEFWNKFYNNNENKFFKNRNWLNLEFPEIFIGKEGDELKEDFNILELGCGVGNTTFPLLEANPNPKFKVFTTDFSSTAIDVLKVSFIKLIIMFNSNLFKNLATPSL